MRCAEAFYVHGTSKKQKFTDMLCFLNSAIKRIYMVPQLVIGQILDSCCGTAVPQLENYGTRHYFDGLREFILFRNWWLAKFWTPIVEQLFHSWSIWVWQVFHNWGLNVPQMGGKTVPQWDLTFFLFSDRNNFFFILWDD